MSKPLRCKLGLHATFTDTVMRNVGTADVPMYFADSWLSCNDCEWTTKPRGL